MASPEEYAGGDRYFRAHMRGTAADLQRNFQKQGFFSKKVLTNAGVMDIIILVLC